MRERTNLAVWAIAAFLFCAHVPTAVAWDDWENDESSLVDEHDESEAPNHDDDAPEDEFEPEAEDEEEAEAERVLEEYRVDGRRIYLVCFFGERDDGLVPRKCRQVERELEQAYGERWVTRLNNPSQDQLERIQRRVGDDIGAVIVVTHSTPENKEHTDFDVWDCPMEPEDIADIFDEEWVIWNGCYSRSLCELADNLLPTQCEDGVIRASDDTWREIMRCLENTGGRPHSRDEICEIVFGEDWESDNEGDRPRR